ncbi:hypothetical protein [Streptomyces sp. NBC_00887]|uniref:hypothetical protein n=1 Tax=Streptomyces sp. NBC_00887 TaxID=2975859 RepID=UPI00386E24B1|nr:hypothetical protein OG844_15135 [Streptomyces sp. NBC_00887]
MKVLDFGIAAILRTDVTKLTATGSPIGTYQILDVDPTRRRIALSHKQELTVAPEGHRHPGEGADSMHPTAVVQRTADISADDYRIRQVSRLRDLTRLP